MSLRLRLTLAYVGLFALALTALDVGLYFVVNAALINGIDNELNLGAQVLVQSFNDAATKPSFRKDSSDLPAFLTQGNGLGVLLPPASLSWSTTPMGSPSNFPRI